MGLTVLVSGASGFVGSHLARALEDAGHEVRAMTRRPDEYDGAGIPVHGDVTDRDSLVGALDGVDAAYYLVHSLDSADFEESDAEAARVFGEAAALAGARQLVYLGGLGADGEDLSPHLRSRREVETLLCEHGVPVTAVRAAVVVGHGGISWEMTRQLIATLPMMLTPSWASTRTQPVALEDVVRYLVGVLDHPDAIGATFEIGGSDVLTYEEMLRRASVIQTGRDVPVFEVPMMRNRLATALSTQVSAYWLALLTDVDVSTAKHLIESMDTEVVVTDWSILDVVPGEPLGYDDMVREALADRLREVGTL